jgi:hypothetical protein
MATFSMKIPRVECDFLPKIHKYRAIPSREIALSIMKWPAKAACERLG